MLASLFNASPEVFDRIVLFTIADTPLGPPRALLSLSLICRASHRLLSRGSSKLHVSIFAQKFDVKAPLARLGLSVFQHNAPLELRRRFSALKVFRGGDVNDPSLTEAFWVAYQMFEDSDTSQKNFKQLLCAGLLQFLNVFLRECLYQGSEENHGWPLPNERNSLAVALFWLSSSRASVNAETAQSRVEIQQLLAPFVFAAFRYPIFSTAESCFDLTKYTHQATASTIHGPYPPSPLLSPNVPYFGEISRNRRIPSVALFAILSFFTRKETLRPMIPPHLLDGKRLTREEADALGKEGPTLDDMEHFISRCQTQFASFPAIDFGEQHSSDILPLALDEASSYNVGTLTGRWQGSYITPYLYDYEAWLSNVAAPPEFSTTGRSPLYMTLQEYFTRDAAAVIPRVDMKEGTTNAWLPRGFQWVEKENGIEVSDEEGTFKAFYESFRPGETVCNPRDVVDVIVTGKTDAKYAAAWGDFHILGRIRLEDGLMVLARKPVGNNSGTILLRGYITPSQNLVGRSKGASNGTEPAGWEAAFSLCKDHATDNLLPTV
ncbi:hypothetical protein Hypma_001087 [Hypsizygus marmoreus]|uniref:Uncharacterized protein n=1 Tax=Hypsizygus marmoreus TaxID=39966 RepID=A0A369J6S1_HYPMA|nr:hypothetical protein Hypma_001087 [Hypsizygus marmoreus]